MTMRTKEDVLVLVKSAKNGSEEAFRELEEVAKPLLISLSSKFAGFHDKFEFEDFYSIGLHALHTACTSFNDGNPSFISYAKVVILRSFWREVEYWNQGKRNIFINAEISLDGGKDDNGKGYAGEKGKEELLYSDDLDDIMFLKDFRSNLNLIIDDCFEASRRRDFEIIYF